jgi:dipeptidyl aminopeptidase/acylaminoacyl peptidase
VTRANPRPRAPRDQRPSGGRRLPVEAAPALSALGLVVIGVVTLGLFSGALPLPGNGGPNGPGGPIRTPTPSNIVVVPDDPRADVPGSLLYVKDGNIWVQSGDTARQLTSSGEDSMPAWSPDGTAIYFVRTRRETGKWPSGGFIREYSLQVPTLFRMAADGSGEPEDLLTGRLRRSGNTWSYFIREPAVSPDGTQVAIVTDGPDPTQSDVVVKLLNLASLDLVNPRLGQTQSLGHQDPAWSNDGRFLLYVRNAREGARGMPAIYRYNPANDRSIAITGGGYADPSWSRDGRTIVATKTSNFGTDVVILDSRTGVELLKVTRDEQSFNPVWSPKGDAVAFFKVSHGVVDLYLVPVTLEGQTWTAGEPLALTISAGLDAASRPTWFIPADQLPPLPTPTPTPAASRAGSPAATTTP